MTTPNGPPQIHIDIENVDRQRTRSLSPTSQLCSSIWQTKWTPWLNPPMPASKHSPGNQQNLFGEPPLGPNQLTGQGRQNMQGRRVPDLTSPVSPLIGLLYGGRSLIALDHDTARFANAEVEPHYRFTSHNQLFPDH
ncbi:unnamed protein product [Cochlearia groenlandica]